MLISPVLDLTTATVRRTDAARPDPFLAPDFIERTNLTYAGDTPLIHPRLDLLGADPGRWPPVLVQTGGLECLTGDAELLRSAVSEAGGRCEVQIWPGRLHGFPAFDIPEGRAAREYGGRFLAAPPVTRPGAA
ncbi:alpha/beta hydrolase [Actinophytocola sp.]|uniref:alpha/beta hydrolase n=1 Tax=Actinophytocola sp. TaxID=1872138 RepID=UPI003D6BF854